MRVTEVDIIGLLGCLVCCFVLCGLLYSLPQAYHYIKDGVLYFSFGHFFASVWNTWIYPYKQDVTDQYTDDDKK